MASRSLRRRGAVPESDRPSGVAPGALAGVPPDRQARASTTHSRRLEDALVQAWGALTTVHARSNRRWTGLDAARGVWSVPVAAMFGTGPPGAGVHADGKRWVGRSRAVSVAARQPSLLSSAQIPSAACSGVSFTVST